MGPCDSASLRIATARVGSCGVSITTTPSDVVTKLGLHPRSVVSVNTLAVTCSMTWLPMILLGRGQAAVDGQDLTGDVRRGIGAEEQNRSIQVLRLTNSVERDATDELRFELRIREERRHLRGVYKGRRDGVDR